MNKLNLNNLNAKAIRVNQYSANNTGNAISSNYSTSQKHSVNKDSIGVPKATTTAGHRRKCYNNEQEEEDGLEEASRILTLDDFAPNYHQSAKPLSPTDDTNPQLVALRDSTHQSQNIQQLVSFRNMTSKEYDERVAAALIMSGGTEGFTTDHMQ